MLIMLHN